MFQANYVVAGPCYVFYDLVGGSEFLPLYMPRAGKYMPRCGRVY